MASQRAPASRIVSRTEKLASRLSFVAALAWAAHRAIFPLSETDLFFHLKLGEIIVATHRIPFRNLFSFTFPDYKDDDLSWAFQVAVALVHRAGGFGAIVLFKAALVVAATALVWLACRRRGLHPLPTLIALVAAIETARPRLVERPHLVTFVGLGALAAILSDIERHPRRWWWLPALALAWAQFHAGAFFCPLVVILFASGARLEGVALPWRRIVASLALVFVAMFATPAGTRLPRYLLWHTGLGATRIIDEFRHADAWNDPWFFALAAACIACAVARRRWRNILPAAAVAFLAHRSVRFVAEFAFVAAPLVADGVDRLLASLRPRVTVAVAAALALVIVADGAADPAPPKLADDVVPFDAIDFVTRTGLRRRMFHDLDVGCYLAWQGWPRWQVFEDARLPAYPDEFHRAMDATPNGPAFDRLLQHYGVDAALVVEPAINRRSDAFDADEWALVWRRPSALVFARRTPAHDALIADYEIPTTRTRPLRSPVDDCEWQRRLWRSLDGDGDFADALARGCLAGADEAEARFRRAVRLQRRGQLAAAVAEYDRVLALRPADARARINRAWAILPSEIRRAIATVVLR